ncbi:hypothetical protein D3C78_672400 [compost metagenome]
MKRWLIGLVAAWLITAGSGCASPLDEEMPITVDERNAAAQSQVPKEEGKTEKYARSFELRYEAVDGIKQLDIKASPENRMLLASYDGNYGVIELYRNDDDEENVYAALRTGTSWYEIGVIGFSSLQNANDFTVEETEALSHKWMKITGLCGANCPAAYYVDVSVNPPLLLSLDAHTVESDTDQDGIKEIIATVGTAAQTTIYKTNGEKLTAVNLNDALHAQVVLYHTETRLFQAELEEGKLSSLKLMQDRLQLVQEELSD